MENMNSLVYLSDVILDTLIEVEPYYINYKNLESMKQANLEKFSAKTLKAIYKSYFTEIFSAVYRLNKPEFEVFNELFIKKTGIDINVIKNDLFKFILNKNKIDTLEEYYFINNFVLDTNIQDKKLYRILNQLIVNYEKTK